MIETDERLSVHVRMRVLHLSIFILGEFGFLLTTIALIFFILIFIQNCFPTSSILLVNSDSSFSFPANNAVTAVSSAYHQHI